MYGRDRRIPSSHRASTEQRDRKVAAQGGWFGYSQWTERYCKRKELSGGRGNGETTMEKIDRITIDAARMNGEPCIRDLRLTVRRVLEALAVYPDRGELKREFPGLEEEDIREALAFAAALVDDKVVPLPHAQ